MFIPSFSDSMSVEDIDKRIKDSRERIRTLNLDIPYLESRKIFAHQKVLDARSVSHLTNEDNWDEYYRQLSLREEELRRAEDELKAVTDKLYDEQKYLDALEEHRKKIWQKRSKSLLNRLENQPRHRRQIRKIQTANSHSKKKCLFATFCFSDSHL